VFLCAHLSVLISSDLQRTRPTADCVRGKVGAIYAVVVWRRTSLDSASTTLCTGLCPPALTSIEVLLLGATP